MRIIAGTAKGRKLAPVPGEGTRPITDMVKGALFSILGSDIEDATFLDLFGGTGAVGLEALSRGAEHVVFVERAYRAVATIGRNLDTLEMTEQAQVIQADAFRFMRNAPPDLLFDFIYVAPPQYQDLWAKVLLALNDKPMLAPGGRIIVQIHPKEFHDLATPALRMVRERRYGSTVLYFYELNEPGHGQDREDGAC